MCVRRTTASTTFVAIITRSATFGSTFNEIYWRLEGGWHKPHVSGQSFFISVFLSVHIPTSSRSIQSKEESLHLWNTSVVQRSQVLMQLLTIHLLGMLSLLHKPILEYIEQPPDLSKQSLSAILDTFDRWKAKYVLSTSYVLWVVLLYLFVLMTADVEVDLVLSLLRIAT